MNEAANQDFDDLGRRLCAIEASPSRLAWYVYRLKSMSLAEIPWRFREALKKNVDRRRDFSQTPAGRAQLRLPLVSLDHQATLEVCARTQDSLLARKLNILGQTVAIADADLQNDDFWFTDPVTGVVWPGRSDFCFDVQYRHNDSIGDIKYVWELSRLQFLPAYALYAVQAKEAKVAALCFDVMASWTRANPCYMGIHWSSNIEVALRAISIALTSALLQKYMSATETILVARLLERHLNWLERYPSRYSSANNHRVAELAGQIICHSVLASTQNKAAELRTALAECFRSLFHPDGVGAEQSPTYGAFSMEMVCAAALFDPGVLAGDLSGRLKQAAAHLHALMDSAGQVPSIGDDDEGRVFAEPLLHERCYVASVTASCASLLEAPEIEPPRSASHLRDILFNARRFDPAMAQSGLHIFKDGGLSVFRGDDFHWVFDHGPMGFAPLNAHGHADALSVWLHVGGVPTLIDAGTYLYHSGGDAREVFRNTGVHNTVTVSRRSQAVSAGHFNWRKPVNARLLLANESEDGALVVAAHSGYSEPFRLEHKRSVTQAGFVTSIRDEVSGSESAHGESARVLWLLGEDCIIRDISGASCVIESSGREIRIELSALGDLVAWDVLNIPVSPAFGELAEGRALTYCCPAANFPVTTTITIMPLPMASLERDASGVAPIETADDD